MPFSHSLSRREDNATGNATPQLLASSSWGADAAAAHMEGSECPGKGGGEDGRLFH